MDGTSGAPRGEPLAWIEDRVVYDRDYSKIIIRRYRDKAGGEREWGMVHINSRGRSGLVAAVTEDGALVLERVWRIPLRTWVIELPGGLCDKGDETTDVVALRELLEETGYEATDPIRVASFADAPGMTDQTSDLYLATHARKVAEPELEPSEIIETLRIPLEGIEKALQDMECLVDPKVYAAIGAIVLRDRHAET